MMSKDAVRETRRLRRRGFSCRETARRVGISKSTVQRIAPGWRLRCVKCGATLNQCFCVLCRVRVPRVEPARKSA